MPDRDVVHRNRNGSIRRLAIWTVILAAAAIGLAVHALVSLYGAQQECFFAYPQVPCPTGADPGVGQLAFAVAGVPLVWLAGVLLAGLARALKRHGRRRTG